MMKLSQKKIEFCGKPRKFKRVPASVLKDASKDVEAVQKKLTKIVTEINEKELEARNKKVEANDILIKPKVTKKEKAKAEKLIKEADKIMEDLEEYSKGLEGEIKKLDNELVEGYGVIAETLLEPMTVKEFVENHDSVDMVIAKNLSIFYDMYMAGFSEVKIEQRLKQMIDANIDQLFPDQ